MIKLKRAIQARIIESGPTTAAQLFENPEVKQQVAHLRRPVESIQSALRDMVKSGQLKDRPVPVKSGYYKEYHSPDLSKPILF